MIRIERTAVSNKHIPFINYATVEESIVVGTAPLANGSSRTISASISYARTGTMMDLYATRGGIRTMVNGSGRVSASVVYVSASTEIAVFSVSYSPTAVTVSLIITNNTGSSISPVSQTIVIRSVQYDIPMAGI